MDAQAIRAASLAELDSLGFRVAPSLPLPGEPQLRPATEIADRLQALGALFTWVSAPEQLVPSDSLAAFGREVEHALTPTERGVLHADRAAAHEAHVDNVGWRLENMWALAWVLGFEPPPLVVGGMIPQDLIGALLFEFLPGYDAEPSALLESVTPRGVDEVLRLEDLFYCAHNAVRSAQLDTEGCVPDDFHPVRDGGTIHERRHALSWCLSPGVEWDETDVST